jgi:hypothetical protein
MQAELGFGLEYVSVDNWDALSGVVRSRALH